VHVLQLKRRASAPRCRVARYASLRSLAWLAASVALSAPTMAQQPPAAQAVPVGVAVVQRAPIAPAQEFVGRIEAVAKVEIRARITGLLQDVTFKEGGVVQAGAPLFRIEPDTYEAAMTEAQGALTKAQGQYGFAQVQRQRSEELVKTQATAVATLDQRVAEEKTAQGEMVQAAAGLRTAQINLAYTQINAPITGQIGRMKYNVGSLVSPESGALTTIVSVDPIYAAFPVSQRQFLALRGRAGTEAAGGAVNVKLFFSDGSAYDKDGKVNFVDVTVDRGTDTILVRASVPNPDGVLVDGQLVRVVVEGKTPEEKPLVPQAALITDQQGTYVFIVVDGKAEIRRLTLGAERGGDTIVENGLTGGEQVVIQGLQALRPGVAVLASPIPSGRT
jgi:membrane fusion protein (multidrug efflux system)